MVQSSWTSVAKSIEKSRRYKCNEYNFHDAQDYRNRYNPIDCGLNKIMFFLKVISDQTAASQDSSLKFLKMFREFFQNRPVSDTFVYFHKKLALDLNQ